MIVDDVNKAISVAVSTDQLLEPNTNYYLRVYFKNSINDTDKIVSETPFDDNISRISFTLSEGDNYFSVQLYTDEKAGQSSNQIYYELKTPPVSVESKPIHPTVPSSPKEYFSTDFLGKTMYEVAEMCGHSPADYVRDYEDMDDHIKFQADDDIAFYSLIDSFDGQVRSIALYGGRNQISRGYGDIDKVRMGMTKAEVENCFKNPSCLESYGFDNYYTTSENGVDFDFIFDDNYILYSCEIFKSNVTF